MIYVTLIINPKYYNPSILLLRYAPTAQASRAQQLFSRLRVGKPQQGGNKPVRCLEIEKMSLKRKQGHRSHRVTRHVL